MVKKPLLFQSNPGRVLPWKQLLLIVLIPSFVVGIYFHILQTNFIFDDFPNIPENGSIHLKSLDLASIKLVLTDAQLTTRPVANLSFALNYYFHQDRVLGYHLTNILIHIANFFLLYLFIKLTLRLPVIRSQYSDSSIHWIPLVAASLWVVHPLHTESVTYIVQRMNSLAAMFYLLSFIFYIKGKTVDGKKLKMIFFAGSILSGFLALGSKELAISLPLLVLLYEWYFFQDLNRDFLKRCYPALGAYLILIIIMAFLFLGGNPLGNIMAGYKVYDFNLWQRLLTESRVVIFYISLLVFPHPSRMNLDHHFIFSQSLFSPLTTIFCSLFIASLLLSALFLARKERLVSFCILWYFYNLIVESSIFPIELVFEHRTYIPSMMAILLITILGDRYIRSSNIKIISVCGVVLLCSLYTYQRNTVWQDRITMWQDCVKKSPNKARPCNGLGRAYFSEGNYVQAIYWHKKALKINRMAPLTHFYLANALKNKWYLKEAAFHYLRTIQLLPSYEEAKKNYAAITRMISAMAKRKREFNS